MTTTNASNQNLSLQFLIELRSRLIKAFIFLFVLFALALYYANQLYSWLALPLLKFLPHGHLIATQIISPVFVPVKLALLVSILLSAPYFLYQLWGFIAPALYGHERRIIWPFLMLSVILFYLGNAFAYLAIFPMLFQFLTQMAPKGVLISPDISAYLDFTIKLLLIFGVLFEIPIVMVFVVAVNLITRKRLVAMRGYAIVSAFIVSMFIAPPDVLSQTMLALPIWFLYEIGLLLTLIPSLKKNGNNEKSTQS